MSRIATYNLESFGRMPPQSQPPQPSTLQPWPVLQRRRIEKLKNDRLYEFERACDENFEWLENYYQGCVYAALQNKDDHIPSHFKEYNVNESFNRSISSSDHQYPYDEDLLPFSPFTSRYYAGSGRSTASPSRHLTLQQQHHQQQQKIRLTPKNSPAKFKLKSPKTPNIGRIGSPISPYERHQRHVHTYIHTTPRKKLRVTARPSSMRAQRALKAMRKRTTSFQKSTARQRQLSRKSNSNQQQQLQPEQQKQDHTKSTTGENLQHQSSFRGVSFDPTDKRDDNYVIDIQSRHNHTAPTEDRSFTSEAEKSFIADLRASTFKTPSKEPSSRNNAMGDMDVDSDTDEYRSMPGSKARDSMTLKSPVYRSDISMNQDMDSPNISHASMRSRSSSSVTKRNSDLLESSKDSIANSGSKRPKSSPFMETLIPIRNSSPDVESRVKSSDGSTGMEKTISSNVKTMASAENGSRRRDPEAEYVSKRNWEFDADNNDAQVLKNDDFNAQLGTQDKSGDTESIELTRDGSSILKGQIKNSLLNESLNIRLDSILNSANLRVNAESAVRRQTEQLDSINGNHQDDRLWRQAGRKEKSNTSQVESTVVGSDVNEGGQRPSVRPTISKSDSTTLTSTFTNTSSSETTTLRSKVPMTLPEKRTLGPRKPYATNTSTSTLTLPSRLTKLKSTDLSGGANNTLSDPQPSLPTENEISSVFQSVSSNKMSRVGPQSTSNDVPQHGKVAGVGTTEARPSTVSTTNSASGIASRQGVPSRPPVTSNYAGADVNSINGVSNGIARSESQGSLLMRKLAAVPAPNSTTITTKSVFSLKKPTGRPILPDGVSSAQLISSSSNASARVLGTSSSLAMMQARIDQHSREPPANIDHSKLGLSSLQRTDTKPSASINTSSLSAVISSRKESMSTASNGIRTEIHSETAPSVLKSTAQTTSRHVFAIPAPVRQASIPPRDPNSTQPEPSARPYKTILPEIISDEEEGDPDDQSMPKVKRKIPIPEWASWEELNRAMEEQKHMNPEEIFGPIPVLDVAEIFPGKKKKSYRPRTSSAHWGASDALTPQEVDKYNKDMGWANE
ncbi:hypothetical protein FBU30_000618 [Linnemannia zychae]|nr:hypothetical protein FBU30_000618 [Linnemannia zychae]